MGAECVSASQVQPSAAGTTAVPCGSAIDLYWLPLGAGGTLVRFNGRVYERIKAARERRVPLALYHCALEVTTSAGRHVIELTPVPDGAGVRRGVVVQGPVGSRWLGRFRIFRYELRCWRGGTIPDLAFAETGPQRLSEDPVVAARLLDALADVPPLVWGRDEQRTGEMWNSNSVIAWLLSRSGVPLARAEPPPGGRAPGWEAGLVVAGRTPRAAAVNAQRRAPAGSVRSGRPRLHDPSAAESDTS